MDAEFDAFYSHIARGPQRRVYQSTSHSLATIGWNDAHAEPPSVGMRWKGVTADVAPADHFSIGKGNELRIAALDHTKDEGTRFFQREGFEQRQIFPFASHRIERLVKTFDVTG